MEISTCLLCQLVHISISYFTEALRLLACWEVLLSESALSEPNSFLQKDYLQKICLFIHDKDAKIYLWNTT